MLRVLSVLIAAVYLSACASLGRTDPAVCGVIGTLVGGVGGGFTGAALNSGNDTGAATGGAAAGVVLGGLAGYYLGKALQEEKTPAPKPPPPPPTPPPPPPPPPDPVVKEKIILRGVNFDFDKTEIRGDAGVILDEAATILKRNPDVEVVIEGHTDSTGPEIYNQGLSERRAEAVKSHLVAQGAEGDRLRTVGQGETNPIASNTTRDGRAINRRVELKVQQE
jgi:OOP family OmpA-OmpF porin